MDNHSVRLFDSIALIYGIFFKYQTKYYTNIIHGIRDQFDLKKYAHIIDVGCGTGALCEVLRREGLNVTGMDSSEKMLMVARRKLSSNKIDLLYQSVLDGIPFPDRHFDIAISSYVLHGLKREARKKIYAEMSRVVKQTVIFHDYNQKRAIHTDIVEWLEGGDYFAFIEEAEKEMADNFRDVRVLNVGPHAAWYICTP